MMDNHLYNLILQLTQENKSLWRILHHYKQDAGNCEACGAFWDKMEKDKENHARDLNDLIKKHI